jgi:hypothetical protein
VNSVGAFQGASIVEKGFSPSQLLVEFLSNDVGNFVITGYSNLKLNGVDTALDLGSTVDGGTYTFSVTEPTVFSATISSNDVTSNKSGGLSYWARLWHFKSAVSGGLTESLIESNSGALRSGRAFDRNFSVTGSPEYLWIIVPASYGGLTSFVNPANGFAVPFEAPEVVSVTNAYGWVENYNCYRSTNQTAGAITVRAS